MVNALVMNMNWGFKPSIFSILSTGWPAAFISKGTSMETFVKNVFEYKKFIRRSMLLSDDTDSEDNDLHADYYLLKLAFQSVVWTDPKKKKHFNAFDKPDFFKL